MIVGAHLVGASAASVANIVGVSKSTVSNVMRAYSMQGQTTWKAKLNVLYDVCFHYFVYPQYVIDNSERELE
ncbi:hypothetical protein C0J52_00675 [Blattella germanica]|nr:hypothetical protein C0J52_00675 [Blattella germanica]